MKNRNTFFGLLLFIGIFLFALNDLQVFKTLSYRPMSIHSWAQCERASIAKNYAEESMNFFKPRIHVVLDGEGITGLEFPFVNYSVAILYKLFGFNEAFYRGFVLTSLLFGLYFFFKLFTDLTINPFVSVVSILTVYLSPTLVYYSSNFLPDTVSLGFVLLSWFLFFKFIRTKDTRHYLLFFLFSTLAALIKISSLITIISAISIFILDYIGFFKETNNKLKLFNSHFKLILISCFSIIIVFSWYQYAKWLSETYHSDAFLLDSRVLKSKFEFLQVWNIIKKTWLSDYYKMEFLHVLKWLPLINIVFYKKTSRLLFTIVLLLFLGNCSFTYLLFTQFRDHDYYIITLLPLVFFIILTFAEFVSRVSKEYFPLANYIFLYFFIIWGIGFYKYANERFNMRYSNQVLSYTGDYYYKQFYELEPILRNLGIKKHDITLTGFDMTYCNSLYYMNQLGWQMPWGLENNYYAWMVMSKNPQYLVIGDTAQFNKYYPNDFENKIIGTHKGLIIYKLR